MRYVIAAILCAVFFVGDKSFLADPAASCWVKAFTYHFFHANIFHLLANLLSIWFMFKAYPARTNKKMLGQLLIAFCIATLTYGISPRPVIGVSNILFAVIGLRSPAFNHPWWKSQSTLIFFGVTAFMLLFPQFAAITHIVSFLCGAAIAALVRKVKELDYDLTRATR